MRLSILLVFYASTTFTVQGFQQDTVIVLKDKEDLLPIGTFVNYHEDRSARQSLHQILSNDVQQEFKRYTKQVYTSKASGSAVWFKVIVQNKTGEDIWLSTGGNVCWYIDFYRPAGSGYDSVKTGGLRPVTTREYPVNFFWLKLADKSDTTVRTCYVRLETGLAHEFFLQMGTIQALVKDKEGYDFLTAAFVGLMTIMILYNLFLAFAARDKIYVTYVVYLVSVLITITFANGYPFTDNPWFLENYMGWGEQILFFFTALFASQYLNLRVNAPALYKVIWFLIACFFCWSVALLIGVESYSIAFASQFVIAPFLISLLVSGVYLWVKGIKNARFYVVGWSFEIASVFIFFMALDGILPINLFTRNAIYFGTSIEVLMFSLALADRLNILRKEKDKAQAEKVELISRQNEILEARVTERTAEIHHRVKNNLQIISSLINIRSRQSSVDTKEILAQLNGRIFSMGLLHEKLYKNDNLSSIRLDAYLNELADYLSFSFQDVDATSNVQVKLNCDQVMVNADQALTCGLIYNELFTNSVKHAFSREQSKKEIDCRLTVGIHDFQFLFSDNGSKHSKLPETLDNSFGLRFVDQLITSKLEGTWSYKLEGGFKSIINIPFNHDKN